MPKEREIKFSSFLKQKEVGTHMGDLIRSACPSLEIQMSSWLMSEGSPWCQLFRSSEFSPDSQSLLLGDVGFTRLLLWKNQLREEKVFSVVTKKKVCVWWMCACSHWVLNISENLLSSVIQHIVWKGQIESISQ